MNGHHTKAKTKQEGLGKEKRILRKKHKGILLKYPL